VAWAAGVVAAEEVAEDGRCYCLLLLLRGHSIRLKGAFEKGEESLLSGEKKMQLG